MGQHKIVKPEKLATQGTLDQHKQNKNMTQYVLDTAISKTTITTSKKAEIDNSFSNTPAFGFQCIDIQEKENSTFFQKQN